MRARRAGHAAWYGTLAGFAASDARAHASPPTKAPSAGTHGSVVIASTAAQHAAALVIVSHVLECAARAASRRAAGISDGGASGVCTRAPTAQPPAPAAHASERK